MRIVFADTGYWVALLNPHDDLHEKAVELSKKLHPVYIVTSEAVLIEVLNDFSKRGEHFRKLALSLTRELRKNPNVEIINQSSEQFEQGLELYEQRKDKDWSHTDCVSFIIMKERSISEALAYDKHFLQAGFQPLLRD
ncbi:MULTISPECIES: type II toxin-antitoxin system VapC family toxin [unclassified Picosynechococcus]|uniref:type II toxin-antitoxin system VapC family toxin n=1 Tax=unclassified Picosynechococcus TaxID=3079910 RepID=UPI00074583F3|nr:MULTISPECIES: PIN domain-containing protein [unclassified Picosynechococcus]AMA08958.1 nucleic acid-binding protein [Picosynechococcus sp. PCC 73109]QCS49797.1 PIN domain-containing protein [Picosynechococcus sp. PCC 11901]